MRIYLNIVLLLISLLISGSVSADQIALTHAPLTGEKLPNPGQKLAISFMLPKVKDLSLKVRAYVVIDGQAMDITMNGSLDELDRTIFRTEIRAPLSELSYQFFISGLNKQNITSKVYKIKRPCLPETKLVDTTIPADLTPVETARFMVDTTKLLERDIEAYSNSVEVLKNLMEKMK